jgi:glutamyl-tRNA reductase
MKLQLVGCSHHNASIAVRERLAFSPEQTARALDLWQERFPESEAVLLSTCNRTELYTASESGLPNHEDTARFLASFHGIPLEDVLGDLFEQSDEGAIRHLFAVAASLDSMVVGEVQILAQIKAAYEIAQHHHSAGPMTHDVFQAALRVAKRVASETTIHQRRLSVASVAVADFARQIFERFDDKHILVIGAGDTAEETLRYLVDEGARDVTIVNRDPDRGKLLAQEFGATVRPWNTLLPAIAAADLIVSTTGATEPIVTLAQYRSIESQRHQRPLFILDLAVPRDFDPAIADLLGVYLYSLDDLVAVCEDNRRARMAEWPAAERIIDEEARRFMHELRHRASAPTIRRLREQCTSLGEEELCRLFNKLPELDDAARAEITHAFERYMNKILHLPMESLREQSAHSAPHGLLEAIKQLFKLKD